MKVKGRKLKPVENHVAAGNRRLAARNVCGPLLSTITALDRDKSWWFLHGLLIGPAVPVSIGHPTTRRCIMAVKPFVSDINAIRQRAREHIKNGAVTVGYKADRKTVIKILNEALATEIVCVLRYKYHYYMASGIHAKGVAAEFLEHANEEQGHADMIAQRITQLDGTPNLSPDGLLSRSHSEYV